MLNDSIQCVNLGKELYKNFINGGSHLDTTSHQNKKLQLISLMNSCVEKNLNKWNTLSIKFSKGTSKFYNANRIFSIYHDSSLAMIRKYIYTSQ